MSDPRKPRAWQRMLSGRRLDLLDPHPDDVAIEDIAHGLARVARWNGQTAGPHIFSVAQHALLVEAIFTDRQAPGDAKAGLAALLHDAAEYVVGDLISPFKVALGESYKAIELRVLTAVLSRFGVAEVAETMAGEIKLADQMAARLEASGLAGFSESEATLYFGAPLPEAARWHSHLAPLPAELVQERFLRRFAALTAGSLP
ncbi:hydrolase [Lichenifustis flavocetrariae]|uniref:Hydrolase n=1 Tax=Lichenifustis flavocetrariae TaxID=2949735 RepID=A0AA41YUH4_9HYPH|nr:hydrolase [Lichenifustis flavocetrariae]MCW6508364.1 hydrolase [Lichenifustis flavocetrariae]